MTRRNILQSNFWRDNQHIPRSEVERRVAFFEELQKVFDENPDLQLLITNCLKDEPDKRPDSDDLVNNLQSLQNNQSNDISPDVIERGIKILKEAEGKRVPTVSYKV